MPSDETIVLNGLTFRRAWSAEVPEITPDRRAALRASIEEFGVLDPPIVRGTAEPSTFDVIDGWNRLGIAAELGIECPGRVLDVTEDAARKMALDLATARRQLDAEQLALVRRKRVAEARADGKSIRTIASEQGATRSQVERDLRAVRRDQLSRPGQLNCLGRDSSTVPGETVGEQKITGRDGKVRPATRAAKPKPEPAPGVELPAEPLVDDRDAIDMAAALDSLQKAKKAVKQLWHQSQQLLKGPLSAQFQRAARHHKLAFVTDEDAHQGVGEEAHVVTTVRWPVVGQLTAVLADLTGQLNPEAETPEQRATRRQHQQAAAMLAKAAQEVAEADRQTEF